jgi:membrane protein required for colicin V production
MGIIGAFYITTYHGTYIGQWLDWEEPYLKITTFILSFILIVIAIALIGKALTKVIDYAALGFVNKLFGGIFGAIKFGLILSVLMLVFNAVNNATNLVDESTLDTSLFYPYLNEFSEYIWPKLIEITEENQDMLDKLPSQPE